MNAEQTRIINELCEIYHRLDCNRQIDTVMITLLLSLLGYAPVGDMPQTVQGSINGFRQIGHQERYNFTMTAISLLLESPSANFELKQLFNRLILSVEPLADGVGQNVLENGKLSFGSLIRAPLSSLIFSQNLKL